MKTKTNLVAKVCLATFIVAIALSSCKKDNEQNKSSNSTETESATAYSEALADKPCDCETDWFPQSQISAPEEGKGSPFDTTSTTNCIFHQWSWQKFLWLTKMDGATPLFLNPEKVIQVSDAMAKVPPVSGTTIVLQDTEQAGSNGVLMTNPAYSTDNTSHTVYYSIHMDPIMYNAAVAFKDSIMNGTLSKNNLAVFPVGSFELKASWVDKNAIPSDKLSNYYITTAAVSSDGGDTFTNKTVALLGMHVVGVVENHPEFIWATFEHNDLGPNYNWPSNTASSTTEQLLFTSGTTSGLDGISWDKNSHAAKNPYHAYDLFKYGVPKNASGYMNTSQSEPENYDNIDRLNTCVSENLSTPWKNYFYNGSLWINTDGMTPKQQAQKIVDLGYSIANATPGSSARGSLNNANLTMETYTQTFTSNIDSIKVSNLANCFSCHAGVSFTNNSGPIYISHVFDAYMQASEGKSRNEINALKDSQHFEQFLKSKKRE